MLEILYFWGSFFIFFLLQINCKQVVDKYVEFDPVIVLLDALLFKPQAFRHILFNKEISVSVELCEGREGTKGCRQDKLKVLKVGWLVAYMQDFFNRVVNFFLTFCVG